jgi:hypothetical protein
VSVATWSLREQPCATCHQQVPQFPSNGSKLKSQITESCKRYQAAGGFITLSFDDINNPRAIRAAIRTLKNDKFPAMFTPDCDHGANGVDFINKMKTKAEEIS